MQYGAVVPAAIDHPVDIGAKPGNEAEAVVTPGIFVSRVVAARSA